MNNLIYYTINRGINTKLTMQIENGEVIINAPWYVKRKQIQEQIKERQEWIKEKIKEYEELKNENMYLTPIKILGKEYNLRVVYKNIQKIECNLEEHTLNINMPKKYKKENNELITSILMDKLYKKISQREIENIMEKIRINVGFAPEDYIIEEMEDCIAKCTEDKRIIVNPKIVQYDLKTIEYIILHQFCHLKYKNHTKYFWNMIEKYMPDYKKYEKSDLKY